MGIDLLPGDSWAIRTAAGDIASTVPRLRTAHDAAVRLEGVLVGDHWRGEAFDAFRQVVERKPLPQALDTAVERMGRAVEELQRFAARFDEHQDQLRHLRAQAQVLAAEDPAADLGAIEDQARQVHEAHRRSLDQVADVFDWLDDQTTFATPPPSNWDRMTGAVGDVLGDVWDVASSFGVGVYEGVRDLVLGVRDLVLLLDPRGWPELWAQRGQLVAVLQYAWDNPVEFLGELGSALLDLDTLFSDPARWLGRRIPDLLLALATVGMGTVGSRAAGSVRTLRGPLTQMAKRADGPDPSTPPAPSRPSPVSAAEELRDADGIAGRYVRIGVDDARLDQAGNGAFSRTDTVLGRLATRVDGLGPAVQVGRQLPGTLLDEIRAVTDIPVDAALGRLPISEDLRDMVSPWAGRSFGSWVTNGFTSQLGMVDGLLVGHAALSPQAYAALATVTGVSVLGSAADVVGFGQAVVEAGTPEACR